MHQRACDRVERGGRSIAIALQQAINVGSADEFVCQLDVEWRERQGLVGYDFDCSSALSEEKEWSKYLIDRHTDDELMSARFLHYRLNEKAAQTCAGLCPLDTSLHFRGSACGIARRDVQRHAADIGLVGNVPRLDLESDRAGDTCHSRRDIFGRFRADRLNGWNAIALKEALHGNGIEPAWRRTAQNPLCRGAVGFGVGCNGWRNLH